MATKYLSLFIAMIFLAQTFASLFDDRVRYNVPICVPIRNPTIESSVRKARNILTSSYPGNNHPIITKITRASMTRKEAGCRIYKIKALVGTSNCPKSKKFEDTCYLLKGSLPMPYIILAEVRFGAWFVNVEMLAKKIGNHTDNTLKKKSRKCSFGNYYK